MSDLDSAINSINASAAKAENTATFLDDMSTFDDQSSVTNPNNGQTVASISKQVKDRTDELFTAAESDINQAVADAAQSATDAQDAADSIGRYQGLWPDSGGSANKGDTYQTQVSGTPTGQYFTALQNTTVDPVGDDVNWRVVVSDQSLGGVTNYQAASVASMIAGITVGGGAVSHNVGQEWSSGGTSWVVTEVSSPMALSGFKPLTDIHAEDFGVAAAPFDSSVAFREWGDACFSSGKCGVIATKDLYFSDGVELNGGGSPSNVIGSYNFKGDFKITLGDNATKTALSFYYTYFVRHDKIVIDGNKDNQTTTTLNGLNYWWIDTLSSTCGTRADNCYQHGIQLFKVKNLDWSLGGGSGNGGLDETTVSSGIFALAVGSGTIRDVICRENNPSSTQPGDRDGNGIQLSQNGSDDAFWSQSDFKKLTISGCDLLLNGRRGLKVQRANVVAFGNNTNNNNSANIFVGTNDVTVDSVFIYANDIGSIGDPTSNSISTDAVVTNLHVFSNTFRGAPIAQGVDIAGTVSGLRIHSNIELWSGGFADRYVIRSGATNIEISTDEQVNDASGGGVARIYPSELAEITPGRISEPDAITVINASGGAIAIPSAYANKAIGLSLPSGTTTEINTITGGYDGQQISLRTISSTGDAVIKSRSGNIYLAGNVDMTLSYPFDKLVLEATDFGGAIVWTEASRADNF